jgi:hypothetical protein
VAAAQAQENGLEAQIAAIDHDTSSVPAGLLALTPSDWNANHAVVDPYRDDVQSALSAAVQAGADAHAAIRDLH